MTYQIINGDCLVEMPKLIERGKEFWAEFATGDYDRGAQAWAETLPLAICRAALQAFESTP